jgi:hypothetical protein
MMDKKMHLLEIEDRIALLTVQNQIDKLELIQSVNSALDDIQPVHILERTLGQIIKLPVTRRIIFDVGVKLVTRYFIKKMD